MTDAPAGRAMRIGLIHALRQSPPPIEAAFALGWPQAVLEQVLDTSLSEDLARDGALGPAMTDRFLVHGRAMAARGVDAILFTCSAFGPCIDAVAHALRPLPVRKPNAAMVAEATAIGRRIALVATFGPTLDTMPAEFPPDVTIVPILAEGALAALAAGDVAGHDRLAAQAAARGAAGCDVIALAQFSLARAAPAVAAATGLPVLTTPEAAVRELKAALGAG
ncbi:arylsulfatase [Zavarzinia sp. CC-PAN008]|uniref:arylsulfatase n=1 Tax=Zavarzinia sp. CC-PAN008 TaxID=3243332 RepID=UPI003F744002